jgi:hypothetical protein
MFLFQTILKVVVKLQNLILEKPLFMAQEIKP